jgi:hypothetical protein
VVNQINALLARNIGIASIYEGPYGRKSKTEMTERRMGKAEDFAVAVLQTKRITRGNRAQLT